MIYKKKIDFKCIISLVTFFIVLLPHLIWLTENNYVTITYGLNRTGAEDPNILNHIKHPLIFLGKQIGILIPFILMFLFLNNKLKTKFNFKDNKLLFLLTINIVPIALVFLTSMVMGVKIRTMWMTPFYLFFGVFFVYIFQSQIKLKKINSFFYAFLFFFFLSPILYSYVSISQKDKRTDYTGKEIAELIERRWNKNFLNEIMYIVGDEWHAGNLSYHLPTRPKWFEDIKDEVNNLDPNGGIIYTGNSEILKEICPGDFGKINKQGFCMIGLKK